MYFNTTPHPPFVSFRLGDCIEIRHAWTADPLKPHLIATATMRRRCHYLHSSKSFSFVFPRGKTIDVTAKTTDQAIILLRGLNALRGREELERRGEQQVGEGPRKSLKDDSVITDTATINTEGR